ncbi:MAG TPA: DUF4056 domain-containing protein [Candidatus Acidoferrales bacterium]|nr:DUF4056 domain-containing protein [Candidatus Acidoferrales bacterium]
MGLTAIPGLRSLTSSTTVRKTRRILTSGALGAILLALLPSGCKEKWDTTQRPVHDEELDSAFFSGLDSDVIPDVPEPQSLRPCCIFGNDVGVQVGRMTVPGYEVQNVLDISELGTHQYNKGTLAVQPRGGERLLSDEASGIVYTCRGGFIDIAHVRDNADRTFYLVSQIARLAASGGTIPITGEGAERHIILKPLDARLVHTYGLREVAIRLAEWLSFQASIWHEITTWYGWSSTAFSERPSAFSIEDLYSNLVGIKITGVIVRRRAAATELAYNQAVTRVLHEALGKLGPLPKEASRRAFEYVDGIWWDSNKRVPDNQLVRHRNFNIGPKLYPWKLKDAQPSSALVAEQKEFDQYCQSDWTPLGLGVADGIDDVPFGKLATLEIRPGELLIKNGFPFPKAGSTTITQDDFPAVIAAIQRAADKELGEGTGSPAARPNERSRYHE